MPLYHPVPDELLKHIGDITVSFAMLESSMQSIAHLLIGASQLGFPQLLGQAITAEMSFKSLRGLIVSAYRERFGEDPNWPELRKLVIRARQIEESRNRITHSIWGAGPDAQSVVRFKITARERDGLRHQGEVVTSRQMAENAHQIKVLANDVTNFKFFLASGGEIAYAKDTSQLP